MVSGVVIFFGAELITRWYVQRKQLQPQNFRIQVESVEQLAGVFFSPVPAPYSRLNPNTKIQMKTTEYVVEYSSNKFGHRDADWPEQPVAEKTRILVLGDSFTFAEGVSYGQRFTEVVEQVAPELELLNTGVPGMGLDEELLFYINEGWRYQPQIVLLMLNKAEMLRNNVGIYQNGLITIDAASTKKQGAMGETLYLSTNGKQLRSRLWLSEHSMFIAMVDRWLLHHSLAGDKKKLLFWQKNHARKPNSADEETTRTVALIRHLSEKVAANHGVLIVSCIEPFRSLQYLKEKLPGIIFLDYQVKLAQLSTTQELSFKIDPHFNPSTHKELGNWMATDLRIVAASNSANFQINK